MRCTAIACIALSAAACWAQDVALELPRTDLRGHRSDVRDLAFSPDGKFLASTGAEGDIRIWELETNKVVRELKPRGRTASGGQGFMNKSDRTIESIAFHPSGQWLVEACRETDGSGTVRLWSMEQPGQSRVLESSAPGLRSAVFTADGKHVAYNTRTGERAIHHIVVRDIESGKIDLDFVDDRLAATLLLYSPDLKMLASAGGTKLIVWDVKSRTLLHDIKGYTKPINTLGFSPDSTILAAAGDEDAVRLWRMDDGKRIREFKCEQEGINEVAFSPSGKTIATAGNDRSVKLWNPDTGRRTKTLLSHTGRALCLAFSPDGKTLASGGKEGVICLWNINEPTHKDQKDEPKSEKERKEEERRKKEQEKKKKNPPKP